MQYFDSYKFESKAYHSIVWHYRSIDTWLEGICKSHCPQHSWSSANLQWAPGKKSIFAIDDDEKDDKDVYDEADLAAPDLDEDMMDEGAQGKNQGAEEKKQAPKKKPAAASNQCFVGEGNNPSLAKETLAGLGFRVMPRGMLFSNDYRFKWTQTSMEVNYMHFKEGVHIANHISNANKVFTNKIATLETVANL